MIAKTIDEVIENLEQIIQTSKKENSALGYFAALYQKVTIRVKEKLNTNYFDDDAHMEKLDVVFANRYLLAYSNYKQGIPVTESWRKAFNASKHNRFIVFQHLLLGMNAHINLDLGIAAAKISNSSSIHNLASDFNKINDILAAQVDEVQKSLSEIWPTLFYILKRINKVDDLLINFSMLIARDGAWEFANELVLQKEDINKAHLISKRDEKIADLAKLITKQSLIKKIIIVIIRLGERGTPADRIDALKH
jgi:hypothetical protein